MGLFTTIARLLLYGFALVGVATLLFVFLSYGWDGEPPEVHLAGSSE